MAKGRRQGIGSSKPYLTLMEAVTLGVVLPGGAVRVAFGDPAGLEGRLSQAGATLCEGRIDAFNLVNGTVTIFCAECATPAADAPVKLAFGIASGLYVAAGSVQETAATSQGSLLVTVWLGGLHWIEEREYVRVHIPGSRATCRTHDRVLDCPLVNVSARGMLIEGTGELVPGTELSIRLTIPLFHTVDLRGQVVWNEVSPDGVSRAGVKFTHIPPQFQARLANLCMLHHALFSQELPE